MRTEWLNKRVEPSRLCGPVQDFFRSRGLSTKEAFSTGKHRIEAFLADVDSMPFVVVDIWGDLNKLIVDFLPWGKKERMARTMLLSSIFSPFGGGVLVRQDLKRGELMGKVENEFWDFLDKCVLEMTG
jgi:hypothetical protein